MSLGVGDVVSHYEILAHLGTGGMGQVFKACDTRLNRFVVLKFPQRSFSERLMREARLAASVSHRSGCQLLDIGIEDEVPYLVLEYVEGETLANRLLRGPMPLHEAVDAALAMFSGVAAMHGRGLVHGDLKPANVMLTADGPRILDFGLARFLRPSSPEDATQSATVGDMLCGTPGYMAPEQVNGKEATTSSDIFALGGCVLRDDLRQAGVSGRRCRSKTRGGGARFAINLGWLI